MGTVPSGASEILTTKVLHSILSKNEHQELDNTACLQLLRTLNLDELI